MPNNISSFNSLVAKYSERLYWHIRKLVTFHEDADDVLQNTFIKIYQNLSKYRGDSAIYTWMHRIATNEALTFLKKKNRYKGISIDSEEMEKFKGKMEAEQYFEGDEIQSKLQNALETLPAKQKLVFNMRYFNEMKYSEISEKLQTSEGALKASYHHAVKKIEEFLRMD